MTKRIYLFAILVFALLLTACATEAPAPTATLTEPTALISINSQVTYEPTFTTTPTQTLRPTSTPYHTPTITPSPEPTITLPPFPTPDVGFYKYPESISPTGKWIAWQVFCDTPTGYLCFQFIKQDGSQIWSFLNDDIVTNSQFPFGVNVAYWSPDNKFVYMTLPPMDFDAYFEYSTGIIKYSLVNGSFNYIITPEDIQYATEDDLFPYHALYTYGFSNNGQWLVYAFSKGISIDFTLLNLYTGDTEYFSVVVEKDSIDGDIAWSPNDKYFVFSVDEGMTSIGKTEDFSVFLVAVEDFSIKRIFQHGDRIIINPEWISNKEVKYEPWNIEQSSWKELILNIETGEITEIND